MTLYNLAIKVATFAWHHDVYEARDNYSKLDDFISETWAALSSTKLRKTVVKWLLDCEDAEATALAREVEACLS